MAVQGDAAIVAHVDTAMYVMTPEFGAASQLEKIDMLDFADFVAINKFDRKGAQDALRDVAKQYQRNRELWSMSPDQMPVYGTQASRFNDDGVTALYHGLLPKLAALGLKVETGKLQAPAQRYSSGKNVIVPPARSRYLAEIADTVRGYHRTVGKQVRLARERQQLSETRRMLAAAGRGVAQSSDLDDLIAERDNAMTARPRPWSPPGRSCRPPTPATNTWSRSATRKSARAWSRKRCRATRSARWRCRASKTMARSCAS